MDKKAIIYISCLVALIIIIVFAIYFTVISNKTENLNLDQKIVIEKYDENFEIEKTFQIIDKKQVNEIIKICENPSLEQDDTSPYLAIRNDVKIDLGNDKFFMIQLDLPEYCYYENGDTKLVIKMPEGLLEKVNEFLQ